MCSKIKKKRRHLSFSGSLKKYSQTEVTVHSLFGQKQILATEFYICFHNPANTFQSTALIAVPGLLRRKYAWNSLELAWKMFFKRY